MQFTVVHNERRILEKNVNILVEVLYNVKIKNNTHDKKDLREIVEVKLHWDDENIGIREIIKKQV